MTSETLRASCSTCVLRPKADGGRGTCSRTESYPALKLLPLHDCPLFKREPLKRPPVERHEQGGLF